MYSNKKGAGLGNSDRLLCFIIKPVTLETSVFNIYIYRLFMLSKFQTKELFSVNSFFLVRR